MSEESVKHRKPRRQRGEQKPDVALSEAGIGHISGFRLIVSSPAKSKQPRRPRPEPFTKAKNVARKLQSSDKKRAPDTAGQA